jgi:TonB family protein
MKYAAFALLLLLGPLVAGCASNGGRGKAAKLAVKRTATIPQANFDDSPAAGQMKLENEVGVYDGADIEETLAEHMEEVRGCYNRAGTARKYAAGKVMLRFIVTGDGKPQDVLVIATDLGNYDVERCLVGVGRRVRFPPPNGNKGTTFEYPVEFRSTREMEVQDVEDSLKIDHDLIAFRHSLASCGRVARNGASAIFYIEPNGMVASVGLAADSTFDEQAGACLVKEMRRWKMSAALPGRMLRVRTNIPAIIASAEPVARSSARGPSSRRRRH